MAKPWLKFRAQGARWRVYLVARDKKRLDGNEGVTFSRSHTVLIDKSLAHDRRLAVLGHEIGHIAFTHANAELMSSALHCPKGDIADVEESLCALIGPTLGEILAQLVLQGGRS